MRPPLHGSSQIFTDSILSEFVSLPRWNRLRNRPGEHDQSPSELARPLHTSVRRRT